MYNQNCDRNPGNPCCTACYCPLVLSWAMTIHKFQGFEAGFDQNDSINRIIADINDLEWEKLHIGTAYVATSRAKTIGTIKEGGPRPVDSAIYWDGEICYDRFVNVRTKKMAMNVQWS